MYDDMSLAQLGEISKGRWSAANRAAKKAARAQKKANKVGRVGQVRNAVNEDITGHVKEAEEAINRNVRYATGPGAEEAGRNFATGAAEGVRQAGPKLRNEAWKYGGVGAGLTAGIGTAAAVPVALSREHKANLERRQSRFMQQQNGAPSLAERRRRAG